MTSTPAGRRLIGAALRRYREAQGFSLEDAALFLECDRSKISRIETGQRGIRPKEMRELLAEYNIGSSESTALLTLARLRRTHGWWHPYLDLLSGDLLDYLAMETAAARILTYHPQQIPALLQTPGYARAIAAADPSVTGPDVQHRAAEAALARQDAIMGAKQPLLTAVITEGALRQQVGGPAIMHHQLTRLATVAGDHPQITLHILPFTAGAHPAISTGGLTVLQFPGAPGLSLVHLPASPVAPASKTPRPWHAIPPPSPAFATPPSAQRTPPRCCTPWTPGDCPGLVHRVLPAGKIVRF